MIVFVIFETRQWNYWLHEHDEAQQAIITLHGRSVM